MSIKKTLLVADDDPVIRRLVSAIVAQEGLEVIAAQDGEEALQKALTQKPDAILLDMSMPKREGLEVLSHLRSNPTTANIPVGFLTARKEIESYKQALDLGSLVYITKPFLPEKLITFVRLLLADRRTPSP